MPLQSPGTALARLHHGGDEHQQQNSEQVFHHQPSQGHMAARRMEVLVVFRTRVSTTVLATEIAMPNTSYPGPHGLGSHP